jgi:ribosome recycling factor
MCIIFPLIFKDAFLCFWKIIRYTSVHMAYNFSTFKSQTKKAEEWLSKEYSQLHTGRATPAILDSVMVQAYGTLSPLKNVGSITIEDPKTLRIAPWDKNQIKDVEKAIVAANLGLSVAVDDQGVRAIFPMLTTETRERLVKILKEKLEEARITIKQDREKIWNDIQAKEKAGEIPEDEKFRGKDELQKLVDEANANLEGMFEKKEREVMQ